MILCKIS